MTAAQALDRVERYDFLRYYVEDSPVSSTSTRSAMPESRSVQTPSAGGQASTTGGARLPKLTDSTSKW